MTDGLSAVNVANAWLNTLRATSTSYAAAYIELHLASPGAAGTFSTSVGSTVRQVANFAAAGANGTLQTMTMSTTTTAWTNGAATETLTDISLWTAASGTTTFLISLPLTVSKPWASGDTFTLNTLALSLSPIAA
jgi:hypothetical protein